MPKGNGISFKIASVSKKYKKEGGKNMVFGLFKRKDPVCGMKETSGKGVEKNGNWFCSDSCEKKYSDKKTAPKSCCSN